LEFSKITRAALQGIKYQRSGPKFTQVVEDDPLRNLGLIITLGNSHNRFHFRFSAKIQWAISPQPLGISTSNLQDV